jgi:hypothetical protein
MAASHSLIVLSWLPDGPLGLVLGYQLAVVFDVAVRRLYVRQTLGEPVEIAGEKSLKDAPSS